MKKKKYPNSLVTKAHKLAFETKVPNAEIRKKLKLTDRQLRYVLYKLKPQLYSLDEWVEQGKQSEKQRNPTITESFLDFFTLEKFK